MTTFSRTMRVVESGARVYRRTWRASVISTFLNPVLYLLAMGVGLGSLVDEGGGADLGMPYLTFLAPGLLAATAMQTGAGDASYPVMAGLKWRKTYHAALATPIGVPALVLGHLGWVALRLLFVTMVFSGVMAVFGATSVMESLLAVPPATLTGVAFADINLGWAVSDYNEILHTSNGGDTWYALDDGQIYPHQYSDVFFTDTQTGWVVGHGYSLGGTILHTEDGGLTWEEQEPDYGYRLSLIHI